MDLWTTAEEDVNSTTAAAGDDDDGNGTLEIVYNVLVALQLFLMMLSMGCGVDIPELVKLMKKPAPAVIGLVCQLVLMPLLAFITAHALDLDDNHAIGLVVISGCPAGAPATLFALISRGDVTLSVCVTVFSTVLGLATMPLNKLLYVRSWSDTPVVIPYLNIAIAILCTWIPSAIGIAIRRKFKEQAEKIKKIGGLAAFLVLLAHAIVQQQLYQGLFDMSLTEWFTGLSLALLGWSVGFGFSALFCLQVEQRRAIAYGTSFVNGPLALALISVSYDGNSERITELILFPMLYLVCMLVDNLVLSLAHLFYFQYGEGRLVCQTKCGCCKNVYALEEGLKDADAEKSGKHKGENGQEIVKKSLGTVENKVKEKYSGDASADTAKTGESGNGLLYI